MYCLWRLWRPLLILALRMPSFLQDKVRVRGKCLPINTEITVKATLVPIVWHCARRAEGTWEPLCTLQAYCPQEQTLPFSWFQLPTPELCL